MVEVCNFSESIVECFKTLDDDIVVYDDWKSTVYEVMRDVPMNARTYMIAKACRCFLVKAYFSERGISSLHVAKMKHAFHQLCKYVDSTFNMHTLNTYRFSAPFYDMFASFDHRYIEDTFISPSEVAVIKERLCIKEIELNDVAAKTLEDLFRLNAWRDLFPGNGYHAFKPELWMEQLVKMIATVNRDAVLNKDALRTYAITVIRVLTDIKKELVRKMLFSKTEVECQLFYDTLIHVLNTINYDICRTWYKRESMEEITSNIGRCILEESSAFKEACIETPIFDEWKETCLLNEITS